jgi:translation elongation factor EF-1beta
LYAVFAAQRSEQFDVVFHDALWLLCALAVAEEVYEVELVFLERREQRVHLPVVREEPVQHEDGPAAAFRDGIELFHSVFFAARFIKRPYFCVCMANVIVTLQIIPEAGNDPQAIITHAEQIVDKFVGKHMQKQVKIEPFVFGLKKIEMHFMMNEELGSADGVAEDIAALEEVKTCEITNVNRPMG